MVASVNRIVALKGPNASNFTGVTFKADGANKVVFTAAKPEPALLGKLTSVFITPPTVTDDSFSKPIGSGPFTVDKFTPGQTLELLPNPTYFGGAPKLDRVVLRTIPEVARPGINWPGRHLHGMPGHPRVVIPHRTPEHPERSPLRSRSTRWHAPGMSDRPSSVTSLSTARPAMQPPSGWPGHMAVPSRALGTGFPSFAIDACGTHPHWKATIMTVFSRVATGHR